MAEQSNTMASPSNSRHGGNIVHGSQDAVVFSSAASSATQQLKKEDALRETDDFRNYLSQSSIAFFLLGALVGLPCTTITAGAKAMFQGVTGAYGLCAFVTAAFTSLVAPTFAHHIPYSYRTIILTITGLASFGICTVGSNQAGPVIGTMLGGATYAFGMNTYLAVAASFPQYTVVSFSSGCGSSVVLGPALYIVLMGPLGRAWKHVFLVCLCFPVLICAVWWVLLDDAGRRDADRVRKLAITKARALECGSSDFICLQVGSDDSLPVVKETKMGFGPGLTRTGLFFRLILPRYVVPLLFCTMGSIICILGLSPTFQNLRLFRGSPENDLQFEIYYFCYGMGQFSFSALSMKFKMTFIWGWATLQMTIVAIGTVQLFHPFLEYYAVWAAIMFVVGACVGGGVTNTNYKIADEFRRQNQPEEVRSYAMSYGGLGNFGGDALGGCLAILIEVLAKKHLSVRT
ncbi:hypothetical protein OPT61_g532 [Boeremia exigua]|uniref:Uncharacterized protein n=1 Tax=Boeremia exigua TaxID=749465 RepID=A0ACC2ITG4_9PLEO|nr:hypothetical protein OPT61_g532 [Boeremia exigua]